MVVASLFLERILDLEQVGEVAGRVDADLEAYRLALVVQDPELLVEAVGHLALADNRQLGVDVDGAGGRHQEEASPEILQVVGGQGLQALIVDRQRPAGQEASVEREKAGRIGQRRLDVTAIVADHEGVALEDLDQVVAHDALRSAMTCWELIGSTRPVEPGGPGRQRWNIIRLAMSPSMFIRPRSSAAWALSRPVTIASKCGR
jgi:hypothetical protein